MADPIPIAGSNFSDERGKMVFFNSFDMGEIVRFYEISPANTTLVRGWQGHLKEKKWFYCPSGAFAIHVVSLVTNGPASPQVFELTEGVPLVLEVPAGNATAFKALKQGSKLMVFSDFTLQESKDDDLRYPLDTWEVAW